MGAYSRIAPKCKWSYAALTIWTRISRVLSELVVVRVKTLVPTTHTLLAFVIVSVTLMLLPGPANFFILSVGVSEGRRAAYRAVAGVETAAMVRVLLTAVGLSAVLTSSAVVFAVIRWAGVSYFLYLAARAVRRGHLSQVASAPHGATSTWRAFRKGFTAGLGNPKTLLFFVAFFPQFVQVGQGPAVTQMFILGLVYVLVGTVWDLSFAYVSGIVGGWLWRRPQVNPWSGRIEAVAYLGLAAYAATTGNRSQR